MTLWLFGALDCLISVKQSGQQCCQLLIFYRFRVWAGIWAAYYFVVALFKTGIDTFPSLLQFLASLLALFFELLVARVLLQVLHILFNIPLYVFFFCCCCVLSFKLTLASHKQSFPHSAVHECALALMLIFLHATVHTWTKNPLQTRVNTNWIKKQALWDQCATFNTHSQQLFYFKLLRFQRTESDLLSKDTYLMLAV